LHRLRRGSEAGGDAKDMLPMPHGDRVARCPVAICRNCAENSVVAA
jgi:hypothetical protein